MMQMKLWRFLTMMSHSKSRHLLVLLVVIWMWIDTFSSKAFAWAACPRFIDAIPLVPEIAETTSTQIGQDFYTSTLSFHFSDGMQVILSSSPNGQDAIATDDQFFIQASLSGQSWSHDFRNPARTQIVPLPAQDISYLFVVGENTVTVKVTDLFVPNYSSRPYFLVLLKGCATPTIVPTSTPTILPTATDTPVPPSPTATETATPIMPMIVASVTPSETPIPSPTATLLSPTSTSTAVLVEITSPPTEALTFMNYSAQWILVGCLIFSVGGTGLWWLVLRRRSWLTGEIDVYLYDVFVSTYMLSDFPQGAITVGQRGDITLPELPEEGVVAQIVATEGEGNTQMGPFVNVLIGEGAERRWVSHILTDGYALIIGPYRLTYRSYQPEMSVLEEETYA